MRGTPQPLYSTHCQREVGMDKVEVEVVKQPPVIGLDNSVHLHHDVVGRQLLWHHEWQPDLVVKGLRSECEVHAVARLDILGEVINDICNTRERGELGLGIRVYNTRRYWGIIVKAYDTMHALPCTT